MRSGAWSATGRDGLGTEGTALACVVGFILGNAPPLTLKRFVDPIMDPALIGFRGGDPGWGGNGRGSLASSTRDATQLG